MTGLLESVSHFFTKHEKTGKDDLVEGLRGLGIDADTQCNMVLAMLVGSTVELSQGARLVPG